MSEEAEIVCEFVDTPYGVLIGTRLNGVTRFSRVRYGKPPVGRRRFDFAEPVTSWEEPLDCTGRGAVPPQLPSRLAQVMGDYPMVQDEDCLHVDIWVPEKKPADAPVFVFFHGGAFMTGGGSLACYDGALLAETTEMIVVTVSYRLGALGFMAIKGIAPPNLGIHDQIAALRFIRELAPALGGNAENITVAGQSAGAFSIALLLASPAHNSLFRRSVIMSAPLGIDLPTTEGSERFGQAFMEALGLSPNDRDGLQAQPIDRLIAAQRAVAIANVPPPGEVTVPYLPSIDGELVPVHPLQALKVGIAEGREMMIGTTRDEMASFYLGNQELPHVAAGLAEAAFRRRYGEGAGTAMRDASARRILGGGIALLSDIMTEAVFTGPSLAVARAQVDHGPSPYVYRFDWQSPASNIHACHCIELPFLFGNVDTWRVAPMLAGVDANEVAALGDIFRGALAAFAKSGKPEGPDLPAWPTYGDKRVVQHFDKFIQTTASAFDD